MLRSLCCAGFLVFASSGCSGDGDGGGGGRPTPSNGPNLGPQAGKGGGTGAPSTPGGFGNPNQPIARPVAGSSAMSGGTGAGGSSGPCEVGKFCEPTSPDGNCGSLRLESDVEIIRSPGNILVIFDQSSSMDQPWSTGGSKLQAAQNALVQALTPLQDVITAGAIFFPTAACFGITLEGGAVEPIEGPQQIPFQPGMQFLQSWQTHWANRLPFGIGTPMNEAFDRADIAIQSAMLTGQLAVIAFTDGEPNCIPDPMSTMVPTMLEPDRAADWLAKRQIKTYMVGLPGAMGVQILDQVAMSGGTMKYILPDDPAQLEMVLKSIVEETVKSGFDSCSINLMPAAEVPDELLMIVEETGAGKAQVPRDRGWTLSADGAHVEITGPLCDQAMTGRFSSITFEYACPDVPPPPPLPPVE
jgi:hypothetical protein